MRTPDVIKKGLECCIEGRCSKCPYEQVCDKHLVDGGDTIPTAEPLADFLTLIQQLERERDAAVEDLKKMGEFRPYCGLCAHEKVGIDEGPCGTCREGYFENNWQWRGVQEVE